MGSDVDVILGRVYTIPEAEVSNNREREMGGLVAARESHVVCSAGQ